MITTARHCCDGRCQNGQPCASFAAPIEIDGPYTRGWRRLLRDLWSWIAGDTP